MLDKDKTKEQLLQELAGVRQQIAESEALNMVRQRTEEALRQSEEQLKLVLEASNDGFWDWNVATGTVQFSSRWAEMLGYRLEDIEPHVDGWKSLLHPDDSASVMMVLNDHLAGHTPYYEVEHRLLTKSGQWRWILARGKVVHRDQEGNPLRMVGTHTDISERKWVEEVLQQRNCELALLNHVTQAFNSTLDLDEVLVHVLEGVRYLLNISACSVWLLDADTGELVCRQASGPQSDIVRGWRLAPGEGIAGWVVHHGESLVVGDTRNDQRHFKQVDQQIGIEHRSILSIPLWVKQKVIGALHVLDAEANRFNTMDVTLVESLAATAAIAIENARLYEQARQDAATKSMLLHEVNHRVKNNLSAIIGLLYVEQRHTGTKIPAMIEDLVSRIQGMATVHRLLSSSQWSPVLISELATQIIYSAMQVINPDKHVGIDVSPSSIRVTPKQANGLALILNELATNSLKYALTDRETVTLAVRVRCENEFIQLEFRDNGPGYPEETLRLERHNVGLYLIQALVTNDLRGELVLGNDSGAVTNIRFKVQSEV